ncbi:MAG TPA: hypothetical protein VEH83_07905 [Gemmatimonadales bacterium]|nr:hypothetical protein [Gemmatimonadales bacterium]
MQASPKWRWLALAAACGLVAASPAQAQKRDEGPYREGFWIGVGLGYGSAAVSCSLCTSGSRTGAATFTLRMGGTPSRQLLIGGELNAWGRNTSGVDEAVGDMSAVVLFYPSLTTPVFLKGGLGVAVYSLNTSPKVESEGLGVSIGVGADLYTGRRFSLTPFATFMTAISGNLKVGGADTGVAVKPNLLELGLTATWH